MGVPQGKCDCVFCLFGLEKGWYSVATMYMGGYCYTFMLYARKKMTPTNIQLRVRNVIMVTVCCSNIVFFKQLLCHCV